MIVKFDSNLRIALLAIGVSAGVATAFGLALSTAARPGNLEERLASIEQKLSRAETQVRPLRTPSRYRADQLCAAPVDQYRQQLRATLTAEVQNAGLSVDALEVIREESQTASDLAPLRVRLSVGGEYGATMALLTKLAGSRPSLFVDSLDLVPKISTVTLTMSGRVFCVS